MLTRRAWVYTSLGIARTRLRWGDLAVEAAVSVLRHPGRSAMTALGTVLAAGSFVATLGLTSTLGQQVSSSFDIRRATEVLVRPEDTGMDPQWHTPAAVNRLRRLNGVVHAGRRLLTDETPVRRAAAFTADSTPLRVLAADAEALRVIDPHLRVGRLFDTFHDRHVARVVLLPAPAADRLGITRTGVAVYISDQPYTVIGIFDDVARRPEALQAAVVPLAVGETLATDTTERDIVVETAPGAAQLIGAQAPFALRPQDPDALTAIAPPDPRTLRREVEGDVSRLSLLLSLVALVIGTVSIDNAATAAIVARIPEIGLRRAVGARPAHLFVQLLAETTALGTLGGLTGALLGTVVVAAVSMGNGWVPVIDLRVAVLAVAAGAAAGAVAGLVPAVQATRIQPVAALQR